MEDILDLDGVPVLYWIDTLQSIYPFVTHMTLTNIRTSSPFATEKCIIVVDSVQCLSLHVTTLNENGIPNFLRSFPNLVTLSLDSDPNSYKGSQRGYCNTHHHDLAMYDPSCLTCSQWLTKVEAMEQIMATQLAWKYPNLQQVLIPRLILEDSVPINPNALFFDGSMPKLEENGEVDWIELLRRKSDVSVWVVETELHETCRPGCKWKLDQLQGGEEEEEVERQEFTAKLNGHLQQPCASAQGRKAFRVVQPIDYNEHNQFKQNPDLLPWDEFPKFWWSRCQKTRVDRVPGRPQPLKLGDATKLIYCRGSGSESKLFNAWDL
ncbi:hypothetical protein FRC17_010571 [Serendipita sp. 399]|nr:hypothetical protein FRC17_010571 [Serendipita sp. 399]